MHRTENEQGIIGLDVAYQITMKKKNSHILSLVPYEIPILATFMKCNRLTHHIMKLPAFMTFRTPLL